MEDNKNTVDTKNNINQNDASFVDKNDNNSDVSNQFDKLFSSLNLSKRKEKPKVVLDFEPGEEDQKTYFNDFQDNNFEEHAEKDELKGLFAKKDKEEKDEVLNTDIKLEDSEIDVENIKNALEDISSETSVNLDLEEDELIIKEKKHIEAEEITKSYEVESMVNKEEVEKIKTSSESQKIASASMYSDILDPELKESVNKLKSEGYEGNSFTYSKDVNAATIPEVKKEIDTLMDGSIDFNKIVSNNTLMEIDSIYSCNDLIRQMSETVFMIEVYAKTLPDNLPIDVKRQSVLNIIKASSIDISDLLSDAYKRIDILNEVLEDVSIKSDELDKESKEEIAELELKIQELKQRIQNRSQYKKSQNSMIAYEIQRIVNIVEFINPE